MSRDRDCIGVRARILCGAALAGCAAAAAVTDRKTSGDDARRSAIVWRRRLEPHQQRCRDRVRPEVCRKGLNECCTNGGAAAQLTYERIEVRASD
jgi:hypothetical protein